jgi:DNA invertase Pin-like site-specific DNA recombinase
LKDIGFSGALISVEAQVRQLTKARCKKVFRETASGAKTDRSQLRKALDQLDAGDVLMVTRLDRLAALRGILLNTLATIAVAAMGVAWLANFAQRARARPPG